MASMRRVLGKRVLNAFITIVLIMLLNFLLFRVMPGDPARLLAPRDPNADTQAIYQNNLKEWGLDKPVYYQLGLYFLDTFTGKWGTSYYYHQPVLEVSANYIVWTLLLLGVASSLTFIIGIVLGKVAANRRGKLTDVTISSIGIFFYGMPIFWLAIVLMVIFVGWFGLFPVGGYLSPGVPPFPLTFTKIGDMLFHMFLPVTTLVVGSIAGIMLIQRNALVDVLTEDYITTAYAKGLKNRDVMKKHASPNARLPVMTTIAMDTAFILGGAFQVEVVFSYQGIGWVTVQSIYRYDYPMLQFIFLIGGIAVVLANLVADLLAVKLDPRVRIV